MADIKDEGEFVATLIDPSDYAKNVNRVATVWTNQIRFIRRKEFAMQPFAEELIPMGDVKEITYRTKYAILPMLLGFLCIAVLAVVLYYPIPEGTTIKVGALAIMAFAAYKWIFGAKRHLVSFQLPNRSIVWQSNPGDYKLHIPTVAKVVSFALGIQRLSRDSQPVPTG